MYSLIVNNIIMTVLSLLRALAAAVLLLLTLVVVNCESVAAAAAESPTPRRWSLLASLPANNIAFLPRGGGAIGFSRRGKATTTQAPVVATTSEKDGEKEVDNMDEETSSNEAGSDDTTQVSPFQQAYQEEVSEIKKSQQFLQMQQRRRELDKTWFDKGITAVIELFENMFRWEVID